MIKKSYTQQISITDFTEEEVIKALIEYAYNKKSLFIEADKYELIVDEHNISVKSIYRATEIKEKDK